jgi:hypothetical protein
VLVWVVWILRNYGLAHAISSNPSVQDSMGVGGWVGFWVKTCQNMATTIVPHFFSGTGEAILRQPSHAGSWRDWFFLLYQTNLFFSFGTAGMLGLGWVGVRARVWRNFLKSQGFFWLFLMGGGFVFGIVAHGDFNECGLMHICSQPMVFAGLGYLGGRLSVSGIGLRLVIAIGALFDFLFGIVFHFSIQGWPLPDVGQLTDAALNNASIKMHCSLAFLGDSGLPWRPWIWVTVGIMAVCLLTDFLLPVRMEHGDNGDA